MTISRYDQKPIIKNTSEIFLEHFKKRGVSLINHYGTFSLDPGAFDKVADLLLFYHVWKIRR